MPSVLIIEDQAEMRANLELMLRMEGYSVFSAEDGRRGLELAQQNLPDIILCDIMMPDLSGYDVLQALRARPETATTPFIFITAKGEKNELRAGMNLGADDYLVKPAARKDVLDAIRSRLQRKREQDEHARAQVGRIKFTPDFSSALPLQQLGLSPREADVLLWMAQGKSNEEIGLILGTSRNTVKKQVLRLLKKLGVESRNGATLRAIEVLAVARQDLSPDS